VPLRPQKIMSALRDILPGDAVIVADPGTATPYVAAGYGSFDFSVGEPETAVRLNLKVVVVQFINGTYGWIKELQPLHHCDRYFGVDYLQLDCAAIARSFGWHRVQVWEPNGLSSAIREALEVDRPSFVDVLSVDQVAETPPVTEWEEGMAGRAPALLRRVCGGDEPASVADD
jgi:acetolactate synthase-1/2/3 large subunit